MAVQHYPAVIAPAGKSFGVVFPDFPGCVTSGETVAGAARAAVEALALHIEGMTEDRAPIPAPSSIDDPLPSWATEFAGGTRVLVPAEISAAAARVNITLDETLLRRVDAAASEDGFTRSGYLAQAAREKLARRAA
ncbi:MAG: type II toxin-antitoxin system HicB family antitoxin [Chthoniobacter sp.]|nr:type II toxin-antitoxin system HicB family antitoxin [Chthoniobacter sp.]